MSNKLIEMFSKIVERTVSRCNHNRYKMVAAIFKGNRLISIGWNDFEKSHPHYHFNGSQCRTHAEFSAINRCRHKHDLTGATIMVYGETKIGSQILAKPCKFCENSIRKEGISKIIYSTSYTGWEEM